MKQPWAVVGRATPFSKAMVYARFSTLEEACAQLEPIRKRWSCYVTHVRAFA